MRALALVALLGACGDSGVVISLGDGSLSATVGQPEDALNNPDVGCTYYGLEDPAAPEPTEPDCSASFHFVSASGEISDEAGTSFVRYGDSLGGRLSIDGCGTEATIDLPETLPLLPTSATSSNAGSVETIVWESDHDPAYWYVSGMIATKTIVDCIVAADERSVAIDLLMPGRTIANLRASAVDVDLDDSVVVRTYGDFPVTAATTVRASN